jgi:hypothetical protein
MKNLSTYKIELVALAIGCLVLFSCATNVLTGQTVKETRDLPAFTGISLAFSGNVYVTQGSPQKVEIEADKSTMEIIQSEVDGSTLVLKTKDGHWRDLGVIKVTITIPDISELSVSGSGDLICASRIKTNEIELHISGSGSVKMSELEANEISAEITGSGDIALTGTSNTESEMDVTITGSGSFKAEGLAVGEASVRITGSGSATVHALKELETNITGSGSVYYKGNPMVNANATGSGKTKSVN